MADRMTPEQRSSCMRRIKSKNTRPEMLVRRFLFSHGFRYRIHVKELPGCPDIAISGLRTCIFINGCFWHGHEGCSLSRTPETHAGYWIQKLGRNKVRDHENRLALKALGWHTVEIWECQLKPKVRTSTLEGLLRTLNVIALENQGAKMVYDFDYDEIPSVAAEDAEALLVRTKGN